MAYSRYEDERLLKAQDANINLVKPFVRGLSGAGDAALSANRALGGIIDNVKDANYDQRTALGTATPEDKDRYLARQAKEAKYFDDQAKEVSLPNINKTIINPAITDTNRKLKDLQVQKGISNSHFGGESTIEDAIAPFIAQKAEPKRTLVAESDAYSKDRTPMYEQTMPNGDRQLSIGKNTMTVHGQTDNQANPVSLRTLGQPVRAIVGDLDITYDGSMSTNDIQENIRQMKFQHQGTVETNQENKDRALAKLDAGPQPPDTTGMSPRERQDAVEQYKAQLNYHTAIQSEKNRNTNDREKNRIDALSTDSESALRDAQINALQNPLDKGSWQIVEEPIMITNKDGQQVDSLQTRKRNVFVRGGKATYLEDLMDKQQTALEKPSNATKDRMIKMKGNKDYEAEYIKRFGTLPY